MKLVIISWELLSLRPISVIWINLAFFQRFLIVVAPAYERPDLILASIFS
ncbi:MAG: hypothetical protein UT93_C0032G0001, partial [Candidatus Woesebacteria bacterium GW2011_GWF1_40_24]